jgi:hypothetical protein
MHVSYDDTSSQTIYDKDYDFMEVVLVELPRMKDTILKEEAALVSLLYSNEDAIDRIEEMLPIKLDRARKEISQAMNWEERTQVYVGETRKNTALQFLEMMDAESIRKNLDCLGKLIADKQIKQCLAGKGIKV